MPLPQVFHLSVALVLELQEISLHEKWSIPFKGFFFFFLKSSVYKWFWSISNLELLESFLKTEKNTRAFAYIYSEK